LWCFGVISSAKGDLKRHNFLENENKTVIVRIVVTLSEGGKVVKNAVLSDKIRGISRKGIVARNAQRENQVKLTIF
jgi:hypothetical protein